MNPSFRISSSMRRLGWIILVLWITACGQVQPAVISPWGAVVNRPTSLPQPHPTLFVIPIAAPVAMPIAPSSTPAKSLYMAQPDIVPQITGYTAYRVRKGDTIASISAMGGSEPELVLAYNRLLEAPQPGRELIIPQLLGRTSELTKTNMLVVRGNTHKRWVALTFDCGGLNSNTSSLLDVLHAANIKVTFFLHGDSIQHNPALLRRMASEGHEIANHSYDHPDFTKLRPQQMRNELDKTERVIQKILGPQASTRPYVRLPYGASNKQVISTVVSHGYLPIHWSIDSYDSHGKRRTPVEIAELVNSQLTEQQVPGAIILMHCMDRSIAAVPQILNTLKKRQIEVHTVTDVLGP